MDRLTSARSNLRQCFVSAKFCHIFTSAAMRLAPFWHAYSRYFLKLSLASIIASIWELVWRCPHVYSTFAVFFFLRFAVKTASVFLSSKVNIALSSQSFTVLTLVHPVSLLPSSPLWLFQTHTGPAKSHCHFRQWVAVSYKWFSLQWYWILVVYCVWEAGRFNLQIHIQNSVRMPPKPGILMSPILPHIRHSSSSVTGGTMQ